MITSCGFIIFNIDKKVLIIHPTNSNHWTFPKGHIEDNETELDCAYRETLEETNLDLKNIKGEIKYFGDSFRNGKRVVYFLFYSSENLKNNELKCQSMVNMYHYEFPENDDFKWIKLEKAKKYLQDRDNLMLENYSHLIFK